MVVVFGSVNLDLVARVERLPRAGETLAGASFAALPGGKGANQAVAARRAGARVLFAGAVGTDAFADTALAGLAAAGVDLYGLRRVAVPTGVALIHVDAGGENCITIVPGANALADAGTIPDVALDPAAILLPQLEVPVAAVIAAARRARARGARVVLNAAPAHPLPAELMATLDVLVINEHEAGAIGEGFGLPPGAADFAAAFHRRFGCAVVVTLGASGLVAAADGCFHAAPAPTVDVVDSTGAGDAFTGALAAALDRAAGWQRALAEGLAAGSLACMAAGAQAALPDAAAIADLAATLEDACAPRPLH
jgi:ribokinase